MARYKQEDRKEIALKKLITLAKKKDFDLVATYEDYHKGKRGWPIKWYEYLEYTDINADPQKIQKVLDDTLYRITTADFPVSLKQMQKEKALFRLTLDAGANPNLEYHSKIFFSLLVNENKIHFAFELAKREGFYFSDNADKIFEPLAYNISPDNFGNFSDWIGVNPFRQNLSEEVAAFKTVIDYFKIWKEENEELVYTLFEKDIYPHDEKIYRKIEPIIIKKDAYFFEKKKEQMIKRLTTAQNSSQIWAVLAKRDCQKIRE